MSKSLVWISITIFSTIGSYIPVLWHASFFSLTSIIGGFFGAIVGIYAAFKLKDYF
ncbi:MAG TPA: hypothetical protein VFP35_00085 [Candidatus Saccharimonadales bacterium]|nr:hypothetical protein [Candidatus Saccharimonadales bacterium]